MSSPAYLSNVGCNVVHIDQAELLGLDLPVVPLLQLVHDAQLLLT